MSPAAAQDLDRVRSMLAEADPDGELAPCLLRAVVIGPATLERLGDVVEDLLPPDAGRRLVLLVDPVRLTRDGEDVKDLAERVLAERFEVTRVVLDDGHPELHVSEDVVATARRAAYGADVVVALGGGTISDIGKTATVAEGDWSPVLVTVQTAASVDGYTDDVSVVLRDGVKRTVPSRWPDGLLADAGTVAEAPARMNRAGYGEMTSMLTAPADWRLASLVGTEQRFHPAPIRLLETVGEGFADWAAGVRRGDAASVEQLTRALAVRGIVTGVAGTTATLSGMEHLVSHMCDLHHAEHGLPMGLHGAQVGVAAVVAAATWELLLDRLAAAPSAPRLRADLLDEDAARARVFAAFGAMGGGQVAQECWRDYGAKLDVVRERREEVDALLATWSDHEPELRALVRPSAEIAASLRDAGAAATFADLDPVVGPELARWAVSHCALMRNRFTVVDLLTLLGWWTDADVQEVLERVAAVTDDQLVGGGGR
ncbi:iron-containing alcohol dehydrogenase [Nocardioides aequoreus]|uniref:iron-containing alcohol dehydrogenase n=1 Tax=Nocardioides aequoreus TaxID=397278 RepID=UPI0004C3E55F|nr:iron-containing alcohol dehydrogenase [Nocardioides aequoreus]